VSSLTMYGLEGLALVLFLEAIGLPIPGALALLIAGAACASGKMQMHLALPLAIGAMMTGDTLLFVIGRKTGWKLLAFLCRVSINPETCILRSAESFYRRGRITLVLAKFIPGINTMAPPLAGSMKMRLTQFFWLDLCGALLYAVAFGGAGFLFSDLLTMIIGGFHAFSSLVGWLTGLGALAYIAYRAWIYRKHRVYREVPRIEVEELIERMKTDAARDILIADVRSHGYYDPNAQRIHGSIRIEPNRLWESLKDISKEKQIYLYCT
jgi:membrane protein DedA with SNARE-associated domain